MVAVLAHKWLMPIVLLVGDILGRANIGRRFITQHVITVAEGVSVVAGIVIDNIGRQGRKHDACVVRLEVIKDTGNAMRFQAQENG